MTDLTKLTASELAARYNELTGKSVKPTSYSKTKFIGLIEAATPTPTKRSKAAPANPEAITLKELCADLGIKPRRARVALRAYYGDKEYTRYVWDRNGEELKVITKLLTPATE